MKTRHGIADKNGKQDCEQLARWLNADCQCVSLDHAALRRELENAPDGAALTAMIEADRPHLFSASAVFVSETNIRHMTTLIDAIESVVALPAYVDHVLAHAPETAHHVPQARGVFLGYDFHLPGDEAGCPQLIEINTNAGGGLLNALLARAQLACCDGLGAVLPGMVEDDPPEHLFMEMFHEEWRTARPGQRLQTIAIVDVSPAQQYLYPEFLLFRRLFERHGLSALICEPQALAWRDDALWHEDRRIDLVYNRLTDFSLAEPGNAALRAAWLADGAVITPHPYSHALYADKRNLIALCDDALLESWGVPAHTRAVLVCGIPRTALVDATHAADLWARRRQLFFKPASGFGSKAAYRGDKLTRRVFDEIIAGDADYVVQALAPPSVRQLSVAGAPAQLKLDLRNYVYGGKVQLVAARLWQGQTTNFRTPGGGFAPVLEVPCRINADNESDANDANNANNT